MQLLDTFRAPEYQPPKLPKVGTELIRLSRQCDVDLREVTQLLERDPLLAAGVLKIAHSPCYVGAARVVSLHQALMRLGLETVTDIVLQLTMTMELFRAPGYESVMEALHAHSTVTAHITRYICSASEVPDGYAFLCGLLHDVGVAGSLAVLAHRQKRPPPLERVWPAVRRAHPEAGAIIARAWNLPAAVIDVISHHHAVAPATGVHRVIAAVGLADAFARAAGFGYGPHGPDDAHACIEQAASALNIHGERLGRLSDAVSRLIRTIEL